MNKTENFNKRRTWAAVVLGIVMPGLGQIYNGEFIKGVCVFAGSALIAFMGSRISISFPDSLILPVVALTFFLYIGIYILGIIDALLASKKYKTPAKKRSYGMGDIVVFTHYGDDRTRLLMRRIVGVAGGEVIVNGDKKIVPENCFYVQSDNPGINTHNTDRLIVSVKDVLGKIRIMVHSNN